MLHIKSRPDIDTRGEKFFDILPALFVAATGCIRMGKLIDEYEVGVAQQSGIHIKIPECDTTMLVFTRLKGFETSEECFGFRPPVWFDVTHDDLWSLGFRPPGVLQHRVGFPNTGGISEKNLECAALRVRFFGLHLGEKLIRVGTYIRHEGSQFTFC